MMLLYLLGLSCLHSLQLALTAAAPAYRGYLADVDCRWSVLCGAVDDRTEEEMGLKPLGPKERRIQKSRYGSVDSYISNNSHNLPEYNDIPIPFDEAIYERLRDHGIDDTLSGHFAHLFIRDPLTVFSDTIDQDDANSSDHFENIQSTIWQTLRFKPPPPNSSVGWRVEFRSMEVQITDFENAAFSIFIVLLSRAILSFGTDAFRVEDNMERTQKRNAVRDQRFWFKKQVYSVDKNFETPAHPAKATNSIATNCNGDGLASKDGIGNINGISSQTFRSPKVSMVGHCPLHGGQTERRYDEMTIDEIINGNGDDFSGLLGLVAAYVNSLDVSLEQKQKLQAYLDLVRCRANGTLKTSATWIREFIRSHPNYNFDSVISQEINYDLIKAVLGIEQGVRREDGLLPRDYPDKRKA